jgi:hypothetical protein
VTIAATLVWMEKQLSLPPSPTAQWRPSFSRPVEWLASWLEPGSRPYAHRLLCREQTSPFEATETRPLLEQSLEEWPLPAGGARPSGRLSVRACRRVRVVRGQRPCLSQIQTGVCPEGTSDPSPAFQRWVEVRRGDKSRRDGRNPVPKLDSLSSLRDSLGFEPRNSVETPGYFHHVPPGQGAHEILDRLIPADDSEFGARAHRTAAGAAALPNRPKKAGRVIDRLFLQSQS